MNDTTNMGRILAVNTQLTETDFAFGEVTFNAYIFTSDSGAGSAGTDRGCYFNLDQFIAEALGTRLGRAVNHYCTVGTVPRSRTASKPRSSPPAIRLHGADRRCHIMTYNDLVDTMHLSILPIAKRPLPMDVC